MPTYEEVRHDVGELVRPATSDQREVYWVTDSEVVGVSRTHEDRLEIFLVGPALPSVIPVVSEALEHGPWWHHHESTPAFEANRLLLPATGHFDQIAAFICVELLRNGADTNLIQAFRQTEPIIGLVIARLWLSDAAMLGLAGELLLIDALCERAQDEDVAAVIQAWDGWRPSLRDLTWGTVGIEVKTTTGTTSTHKVQGTHQVEPFVGETADLPESGLLLVSVGLKRATHHDNSFTLPLLVERIVQRLRGVGRGDVADVFLARVREYGSGSGFGYDHVTMSHDLSFTAAFETTFVRSYDMTDQNISVLRHGDVTPHVHVDAGSLAYTIDLPIRVSGDLNPVVGVGQAASAILAMAQSSPH